MTLKEAVGKVLEGWTLPEDVRKILEEAYFAQPEQEPVKQLAQESFMQLWQSYCDKKMEVEDLKEQLEKLTQPEQEPVAMKFKIYKPTVPDPVRQDINNALLPWVYDQDRSSGFDASMWVTPVATLPPQHKPCSTCEALARTVMMDQTGRDA